jgi:nicotinamide mononucleotide transporter
MAIEPLEVFANAFNAAAIIAAGRNSVHTWWTGIVGCALFAWLFVDAKLYADSLLQLFFIATSVVGWSRWQERGARPALPVRRSDRLLLLLATAASLVVAIGYAQLLKRFTDAAAPLPDSFVLTFSVLGQLLLMQRRIETWWCWLAVNVVSVPLYASRALWLTAALYLVFLINAVVALRHWRTLLQERAA